MYVSPLNRSLLQGHPEALGSVQIEHVTPKRDGFTHQKIGDCPIQHLNQYPYMHIYIYIRMCIYICRERGAINIGAMYIYLHICVHLHIYSNMYTLIYIYI